MEEKKNTPHRSRRRSPYRRNRLLQGSILAWLLVGVVVLFALLGLLIPDKDFSESENRSLAQFPEFSLSSLADGSYLKAAGSYVADQFPTRDFWMSLNLWLNRTLGQREASGVYLCEDNYLMQIPSQPDQEQLERNLAAVNAFRGKYPEVNMVMSVIPNAVTVHSDKLPANAPVRDQRADLNGIRNALESVNVVDVTDTLIAHSNEALFYRTDHHWTSLGAYYAFTDIAPGLGIEAPAQNSYQIYTVSTTFEGTLSSKSGSHKARDTVQIYEPETDIEYYVTYNEDSNTDICSMYDREALDHKDHYTVFFGGNHSRVDITTTADTGRSLLIFKDSYANCFVPFLYPYFDHITMIDPRYYYDNVENVLRSQGITDVLFLYNTETFLSDTSLADVLEAGG